MKQRASALRVMLATVLLAAAGSGAVRAETCTTQAAMAPADRNALADAARGFALRIQSNDAAGLRSVATAELTKDTAALDYLVGNTAPRLAGGAVSVEQVYLLDASDLKRKADGSAPDAQFFCSLNQSTAQVQFTIPALPPGKYAFAMMTVAGPAGAAKPAPWRLSFLMRQEGAPAKWLLAGFYPSPMTAAGHDGLWYWTEARQMAKGGQLWNAWLDYQAAEKLLTPADFVMSTHLDKLRTEAAGAAPAALKDGVSVDAPLVVKGADGTEYHFTGLGVDDSLGQSSLDVEVHLRAEALTDPAAARKRNDAAASALLAAYPELRKPFHGVWVYAEAAGQNPFASEEPMTAIQ